MTAPVSTSRRRFVTGLASTTALGLLNSAGFANAAEPLAHSFATQPTPNGKNFTLDSGYTPVSFTGDNTGHRHAGLGANSR